MLKPYREQFTSGLKNKTQVHPSTKLFAHITKNLDSVFVITGLSLFCVSMFNVFFVTTFSAWLGMMGIVWFIYLIVTTIRTPYIVRKDYNEYLYPIEIAFHQMDYNDQKKYTDLLKKSYQICARGDRVEFKELTKIRELFELSIPEKKKLLSVEEELELKRKAAQDKAELDRMQDQILEELRKENGI